MSFDESLAQYLRRLHESPAKASGHCWSAVHIDLDSRVARSTIYKGVVTNHRTSTGKDRGDHAGFVDAVQRAFNWHRDFRQDSRLTTGWLAECRWRANERAVIWTNAEGEERNRDLLYAWRKFTPKFTTHARDLTLLGHGTLDYGLECSLLGAADAPGMTWILK